MMQQHLMGMSHFVRNMTQKLMELSQTGCVPNALGICLPHSKTQPATTNTSCGQHASVGIQKYQNRGGLIVNEQVQEINTHHLRIEFGKHKGELWTRLPVSYLRWLINENTPSREIAESELRRRGTVLDQTVHISGHAIDRASTKLLARWEETREHPNEGIHAWLIRLSTYAMQHGEKLDEWSYNYLDIKFVFDYGEIYPTLTTIMPMPKEVK
jgi:uncharacterized protein (DUF3820 family)